jgi:predicted GNAT family N-acyltransferase
MIATGFTVEPATWSIDMADLRAVRTEVFVIEQQVPEDEEWDEYDERSHHIIARDDAGRPIGTGRLTPIRTIGRMAIVRDWRGKGIGDAILRVLIERARELRYPTVELHAQTHAIAFYARSGFVAFGEEYDECGIAHRSMRLELDLPEPRSVVTPGTSSEARALLSTNRDEARSAILDVIGTARREIAILTRDLDPAVLDHADVLDALKRLALSGANVQIRILVQEPARASAEGHRLIALAQRLSSVFAFRTPVEEIDLQYAGCFAINDRSGYFERTLASRFDGEGNSHAPPRNAQLLGTFNAIWERSEPTAEMRRLDI